jgi:hypothetical protein
VPPTYTTSPATFFDCSPSFLHSHHQACFPLLITFYRTQNRTPTLKLAMSDAPFIALDPHHDGPKIVDNSAPRNADGQTNSTANGTAGFQQQVMDSKVGDELPFRAFRH